MRRAIAYFTRLQHRIRCQRWRGLSSGYTSEHAAAEVQWEQKFREVPDREGAKICGECRRGRTMSVRPMTRTTQSGCGTTEVVRARCEDRTV